MTRLVAAASLLFTVGCGREIVHLSWPPTDGYAAAIVASEAGGRIRLRALDLGGSPGEVTDVLAGGGGSPVEVELYLFKQPLAVLRIPSGAIGVAGPGEGRSLPQPDCVFAATWRSGRATSWNRLDALPPDRKDLSLALPPLNSTSPCPRFMRSSTELDIKSLEARTSIARDVSCCCVPDHCPVDCAAAAWHFRVLAATRVEDGVLLSTEHVGAPGYESSGGLYLATRAGTEEVPGPLDNAITAMSSTDAEGRLWLATADGVWRGRWDHRLGQLTSNWEWIGNGASPVGRPIYWLDGKETSTGAIDLFALDVAGLLQHYDGHAWKTSGTLPVGGDDCKCGTSLAWVRPQEAYATYRNSPKIFHAHAGTLTPENVIADDSQLRALTAVAAIPGFGTVVGSLGALYRRVGDGWMAIPGSLLQLSVEAIAPFGRGFIFGAQTGPVGIYDAETGLCPTIPTGQVNILSILPVGDGFVVSTNDLCANPVLLVPAGP